MPRFLVQAAQRETGNVVSLAVDALDQSAAETWAIEHGYLVSSVTSDSVNQTSVPAARLKPVFDFAGPSSIERHLDLTAKLIMAAVWAFEALYFGWYAWILCVWFHGIWRVSKLAARGPSSGGPAQIPQPYSGSPPPGQGPSVPEAVAITVEALAFLVLLLGLWLLIPAIVYVVGRFAAAHLRGLADQVRIAKRFAGLPYYPQIRGAEY